ncbi:sugar phosphate nucleotidyltransferase [Bacillus sp. NEB1478]|uniref:sugar phosphate nucleotidyltransferase n=1 Tax=Bacillus sp. NEB1478 TaxID=3073816 RepID=UPI0028730233|nr:sugar phosphate nucleotidyltransferase [Bacillus sp. NEB1478]WNB90298.1 sugar phosphate nucleotidyltransferase [Bacillus sp. NEB1478]
MKVYGVIPAAGRGSRLAPLPFSKEMFPLGFQRMEENYRPRPVSLHLVETFKEAGIHDIFWITSIDKTDIQKYYKSGTNLQMNFCYLLQDEPKGMVDALTYINPWLTERDDYLIALGMPDTIFYPTTIFLQMKQLLLSQKKLDVVLGLFETEQWYKLGMVQFKEEQGQLMVNRILDKPKSKPDTRFAWGVSMWRSSFQAHLIKVMQETDKLTEYTLSDAFNSALDEGFNIGVVQGCSFVDIGTVEDLQRAIELTNILPSVGKDEH